MWDVSAFLELLKQRSPSGSIAPASSRREVREVLYPSTSTSVAVSAFAGSPRDFKTSGSL